MVENHHCCIYLPDDKKLELILQPKLLGIDLIEICLSHFNLEESQYFGICYQSLSGHTSWIQQDKRVLDHDFSKKLQSVIECQFAIKFFVDSILSLKHCLSIELYFLSINSLIYKGDFEVDFKTGCKLAAYALQIYCGNYRDDDTALTQLQTLPLLPSCIVRYYPKDYCEESIISCYKELNGASKGKLILNYLTCAELLPTYGVHYYKVKDKSGLPWWLGISSKGIFQFGFHNRRNPIKAYYWRQLENLYFREKKFSIEVKKRLPNKSDSLRKKPNSEVKVCAWYGSPSLIKTIWLMSIAQHRFNLERKQNKSKSADQSNLSKLAQLLTNNKNSLISTSEGVPAMTKTHIKDVNVTVKKGMKGETPEMRAAKRDMSDALEARRTELEDRLYDKVQELKKSCLQEAEITGKLPPEYVRYMDLNEKPPKLKKRVGAEFKLKLRAKDRTADRDYTSVTAASSSSSGFGSEAVDPADELSQLEQELEILAQIAQAAKKLAFDPSVKGRLRTKRMRSYKKNLDKLKEVELKTNRLREKCGREPSSRASLFLSNEDLTIEDGTISLGGKSESDKSFYSDGLTLDDDTSLSSGGDILSTHSTPAVMVGDSPGSAMLSRRTAPPADVEINEIETKRSLTPPPSFDRLKSSSKAHRDDDGSTPYPLLPSSSSSSSGSSNIALQISSRNWISQKWEIPKSKPRSGWNESSLDGSIDTASLGSRLSDGSQSVRSNSPRRSSALAALSQPETTESLATSKKSRSRPMKVVHPSANANQNNNSVNAVKLDKETHNIHYSEDIGQETQISPKQTVSIPASQTESSRSKQDYGLARISEHPSPESSRRRSLTDRPLQRVVVPRRNSQSEAKESDAGSRTRITKSRSAQDLQPPLFDTNENIQLQYSNTRAAAVSSAPSQTRHQNPSHFRSRHSQPELYRSQNPPIHPVYQAVYASSRNFGVYYPINPAYAYSAEGVPAGQRNRLNRGADYSDITLDLIPSLTEFSSRSSVCESSSAYSRKEDIKRILIDHIAMKKVTPATGQVPRKDDATGFQQSSNGKNSTSSIPAVDDSTMRRHRSDPPVHRTNFYQHLPHPALQQRHPHHPHVLQYHHAASSNGDRHHPQHFRWVSEQSDESTEQASSNLKPTESSSAASSDGPSTFPKSKPVQSLLSPPSETVVVQSVLTAPDGHEMSVFKLTKSAPTTPMMKRHKQPVSRPAISSDESDQEAPETTSVRLQAAVFEAFATRSEKPTKPAQAFPSVDQSQSTMPKLIQAVTSVSQSQSSQPALAQSSSQSNQKIRQKLSHFVSMPDRHPAPTKPQVSPGQSVFTTSQPSSQSQRGYYTLSNHITGRARSKKRLPSAPTVSANLDPVSEYIGDRTTPSFSARLQVKSNPGLRSKNCQNSPLKKQSAQIYRRSQSETWKPGNDVKPLDSVETSHPHFHDVREQNNPGFYHTVDRPRQHKIENFASLNRSKLSASAEDLLWSESGNKQAGTLV